MARNRKRSLLAATAVAAAIPALVGLGVPALGQSGASLGHELGRASGRVADHYPARATRAVVAHDVVVSGLDNPRQLAWSNGGALLVAEAGHGSYKHPKKNCVSGGPEGPTCIGRTGKITRIADPATTTDQRPTRIARGFLSGAMPDGTFAVGSDGVDQGARGRIYVQETYAPPDILPGGVGGRQSGKLLTLHKAVVTNITAFERNRDPDGEGFDSDPYAVLALKNGQLVADAAGDDIIKVRRGEKSLWTLLPGDTPDVDPVPTSFSKGPNGRIYVGTLYSLAPHQARVLRYSRSGDLLRSWGRFTAVTGVAVRPDGTMYVSELFAGCPPNDQNCVPGRVVQVKPNGNRTKMAVPFPAGLETRGGNLYVNAWSIASAKGAFGNPEFSGQVWRIPIS